MPKITKAAILKTLLILYIILSAAYISYNLWRNYQFGVMQQAFLEGRRTAIEEFINQAESSCQPFPVFADERRVEVINVECLVPAAEGGGQDNQTDE